ncbi:MAG: fasciclin domain-containing protein [Patescibacteria group bacterium]
MRIITQITKHSTKFLSAFAVSLTAISLLTSISGYADSSKNIVENASDTSSTSTLVAAVTAADLASTLSGTGPFTVFAPSNSAFEKLGTTVDELLKPENKTLLQDILKYHVVSGSVDAATALTLTEANSLQGDKIMIMNDNGKVKLNNTSTVTTADVTSSNGVIHIIDTVILSSSLQTRVANLGKADMHLTRSGGFSANPITLLLIVTGSIILVETLARKYSAQK